MLWARESNSYRSRGSLHGSRYSRSGATRKGEKATAGQRKNPTTGAVTVSEPTDRQTPKRAGGAVVTNPRKSGTPVGSGSRVAASGTNPHCVESCETLFLKADRRGSHASGSPQEGGHASLCAAPRPWTGVSHPCRGSCPSRVITRFCSCPASGGPPLGGRAGERAARMLWSFLIFAFLAFCTFVPLYLGIFLLLPFLSLSY